MPVAAFGIFLLISGCASARRSGLPPGVLMSQGDYDILQRRVGSTEEGKKLFDRARQPVEVVYGTLGDSVGSYDPIEDGRHDIVRHRIILHDKFRGLPSSSTLSALTFSHELTHAAQSLYPKEKQPLLYYDEVDAYAAAVRVWIELAPNDNASLPQGFLRDFEGQDLARTLHGLREIYERDLEEFADTIGRRYNRLCRFRMRDYPEKALPTCGEYVPIKANLQASRDPFTRLGWELFLKENSAFRSKRLSRAGDKAFQ